MRLNTGDSNYMPGTSIFPRARWSSSIRIVVEVWINSQHDGEPIKVTEGEFVFVAIDENGRTRAIQKR